jgi:hypothetical protein
MRHRSGCGTGSRLAAGELCFRDATRTLRTADRREIVVPQRRLAGLSLALIAAAASAGCEIAVSPGSIPAPFSVAPVPSASAGRPAYVCTAVYKILTDGAVRLAGYVGGSSDAATKGMQQTLADMSTQVTAAGTRTTDATLRQAIDQISGELAAGSRLANPKSFVNGDFQTVGQHLDGACP